MNLKSLFELNLISNIIKLYNLLLHFLLTTYIFRSCNKTLKRYRKLFKSIYII